VIVGLVAGGAGAAVAATTGSPTPGLSTELGAQVHDTGTPLAYATATSSTPAGLTLSEAIPRVVKGLNGLVLGVSSTSSGNGPVLDVQLAQSNDQVPDVWIAGLTVGALAELIHTNQTAMSQVIASASATGPGKDGPNTWTGVGLGAIALGQQFNSPNDAELASRVNQVAEQFGLTVSNLQILHPLESVIDVTFTVPANSPSSWTLDKLRSQLVGSTPRIEGILIQVNSADGQPLARSGIAYRTGEHGLWCAPAAQAQCGGGAMFSTPLAAPSS